MPTSREEWRKRVERWKHSKLTAADATELGIKASTIQYWKHQLGKPEPTPRRRAGPDAQAQALPSMMELQPIVVASAAGFGREYGGHDPVTAMRG